MSTVNHLPALFNAPISSKAMQRFAAMRTQKSELAAGITGGFGVVSFKGKTFSVKYQGETQQLLAEATHPGMPPQPKQWLEAVIIKAADHLSRTYYVEGYKEGSDQPPDCYSIDGIKPEADSPKRQADVCAICPWSKFGTARDQSGARKGKACQESKRMAIVPEQDLRNEAYGGPMLLRIPPSSLTALQQYAGDLERAGIPFWGVSTYIYFDANEAYPRLLFKGHRPLTDEEFDIIEDFRNNDDRVKRIIESKEGIVETPTKPEAAALFGAPPGGSTEVQSQPTPPASAPTPEPTPAPSPAPAPEPAPAPAPAPAAAPEPAPASVTVAPAPVQATETDAQRQVRELQAQLAALTAAATAPQTETIPAAEAMEIAQQVLSTTPALVSPPAPEPIQEAPQAAAAPPPVSTPAPKPAPVSEPPVQAQAPSNGVAPPSDGDFTAFLAELGGGMTPN